MHRWIALVLVVFVVLAPSACNVTPGEITSGFPGELPANGPLIVFARPPLDVTFERIDGGSSVTLEHTRIAGGSTTGEPAYLVDVGDVAVGDTITVSPRCDGCNESADVLIIDADTSAPTIDPGPAQLTAVGVRLNPFDPFVSAYFVTPQFQDINDSGGPDDARHAEDDANGDDANINGNGFGDVFTHYRGEGVEVLRHFTDAFYVEGGSERTLCVTITLMDRGGNTTQLPEQECVLLDPGTASDFGVLPQPPG
jgi:hypothetical protein